MLSVSVYRAVFWLLLDSRIDFIPCFCRNKTNIFCQDKLFHVLLIRALSSFDSGSTKINLAYGSWPLVF